MIRKLPKLNKAEHKTVDTITSCLRVSSEVYMYKNKCIKSQYDYKDEIKALWSFIPSLPFRTLAKILKLLRRENKTSFCSYSFADLGCGIGNILAGANALGFWHTLGLEYNTELPNVFDRDIHNGDLLDPESYTLDDINVIYMYMPIKDMKLMQKALDIVCKKMEPGAFLYFNATCEVTNFNSKYNRTLLVPKDFIRYSLQVFRKPFK